LQMQKHRPGTRVFWYSILLSSLLFIPEIKFPNTMRIRKPQQSDDDDSAVSIG
jgi:hypothetical protein